MCVCAQAIGGGVRAAAERRLQDLVAGVLPPDVEDGTQHAVLHTMCGALLTQNPSLACGGSFVHCVLTGSPPRSTSTDLDLRLPVPSWDTATCRAAVERARRSVVGLSEFVVVSLDELDLCKHTLMAVLHGEGERCFGARPPARWGYSGALSSGLRCSACAFISSRGTSAVSTFLVMRLSDGVTVADVKDAVQAWGRATAAPRPPVPAGTRAALSSASFVQVRG